MYKKLGFLVLSVFLLFVFCTLPARAVYLSEITEVSFPKVVLYADAPVIVWFYAGGAYVPFSKTLADYNKKKGKINIVRMDRSLNNITAAKYKVRKNDTYIFFADGEEIVRTTSINSLADYEEFTEHCIKEYQKILMESKKNEWVPSRSVSSPSKSGKNS